jgi:hypothetical protein
MRSADERKPQIIGRPDIRYESDDKATPDQWWLWHSFHGPGPTGLRRPVALALCCMVLAGQLAGMRFPERSWWQPEMTARRAYLGAGGMLLFGAIALVIFFVGGGLLSRWVELAFAVFFFFWAAVGLSQAVGLGKDERRTSWVVTQEQEWDAALAALREAGWQVEMTGLAAPVQVEGVLPCGEQFYFRSRHSEILLAVGGEDPADGAPWQQQASYGTPGTSEGSYLPAQPGLRLLLDLSAQHRPNCPHSGGTPAA